MIHTRRQVQQDEQHHPIHRYMCSSNPVSVLIDVHVNRQADISILHFTVHQPNSQTLVIVIFLYQ